LPPAGLAIEESVLERILLIGIAGALGALSRYLLQSFIADSVGSAIVGTFLVNVSGAFLLGLVVAISESRFHVPANTRVVLGVGFLGAYTTFSTLMFDSVDRIEKAAYLTASANLLGSVACGLVAVYAGLSLGRAL
jgi:CrcB protein